MRLPMNKRKAVGADSSGVSQPAAPGAKQSRASRQAVEALARVWIAVDPEESAVEPEAVGRHVAAAKLGRAWRFA